MLNYDMFLSLFLRLGGRYLLFPLLALFFIIVSLCELRHKDKFSNPVSLRMLSYRPEGDEDLGW